MTTQHTPGPWTIDKVFALIMGPNGEEVAAIHAAGEGDNKRVKRGTAQANAALIAAAPEMAEALRQIIWKLNRKTCNSLDGHCEWAKIDINDAVIREAKAVLAKAGIQE